MHTDAEQLDVLNGDLLDDLIAERRAERVRCDSCGRPLGDDEQLRFRHRSCPPPTLPRAARDAIAAAHGIGPER